MKFSGSSHVLKVTVGRAGCNDTEESVNGSKAKLMSALITRSGQYCKWIQGAQTILFGHRPCRDGGSYIAFFPTRDSHTTGKCLLDLVRARGGDIKKLERGDEWEKRGWAHSDQPGLPR